MEDQLRALVALGLTLTLVMLRAEAQRFGAAEYDEPVDGHPPSVLRRLAWYGVALIGVIAIVEIHPNPARDLNFTGGDGGVVLGFVLGAVGVALPSRWPGSGIDTFAFPISPSTRVP